MPRRPTLLLRVEVGPGFGAGHLARCLVLARRWTASHGDAVVVADALPAPWKERVDRAGVGWRRPDDLPSTADWVVVDGYTLRGDVLDELTLIGPMLRVDDFGESELGGAVLALDQNVASSAADYPGVETLVGPRFVLLAPESFVARRIEVADRVRSVVVALGGFPTDDLRAFADEVLRRWAPVAAVTVLDGRADVDVALDRADLVLTPAGTLCWQVCHRGLPSVLVATAENQRRLAEGLASAGAASFAGLAAPVNVEQVVRELDRLAGDRAARDEMGLHARALVDGHGAARVVARLKAALLELRPIERGDADRLLAWANDPGTREASFDPAPIAPDQHVSWLESLLSDPQAKQWIATFDETAIGVVRFARPVDGRSEISLTVAPDQRGTGWSAALISAGTSRLLTAGSVSEVVARIKPENAASIRAFVAADYDESAEPGPGSPATYVRRYLDR